MHMCLYLKNTLCLCLLVVCVLGGSTCTVNLSCKPHCVNNDGPLSTVQVLNPGQPVAQFLSKALNPPHLVFGTVSLSLSLSSLPPPSLLSLPIPLITTFPLFQTVASAVVALKSLGALTEQVSLIANFSLAPRPTALPQHCCLQC